MSKPKAFEYDAVISTEDIVAHLEKVVAGLKAGSVTLDGGKGPVTLEVKSRGKFSVEVKESPKGQSLKLKMKWRDKTAETAKSEESGSAATLNIS